MRSERLKYEDFPKNGGFDAQRAFLLRYAVRAPSTHNVQPWAFCLTERGVELHRDTRHPLPYGDPSGRCAFVSLGACFEHLVTAARYFGMYERETLFDGKEGKIAALELHKPSERDERLLDLVLAMETRFNARGPFWAKGIPDDLRETLGRLDLEEGVRLRLLEGDDKSLYADLNARGMRAAHSMKEFRKEIAGWIRNNYSRRRDGIPGYTMLASGPLSLILPYLIGTFNMGPVLAKLNRKSIGSAPVAGVLLSASDEPRQWFAIGRSFERISLLLATEEIRTSVYVAAVETPSLRDELRERLKETLLPQFTFTLGYPKVTFAPTPRIDPLKKLID